MPSKKISIQIDNTAYKCKRGQTVLQVAIDNGIDIPHFCYHEDLPIDANCRTCIVENIDTHKIVTSCTLKAKPGLRVRTSSKKLDKLRKINLQLLFASHYSRCELCKKGHKCKVAETMKKYGVTGDEFKKKRNTHPIHELATAALVDPKACITCNKCVEMCEYIGIGFLKLKGKGANTHIGYNEDPNVDCIYCGQCTVHCPVAAAREQSHISQVEEALHNKKKIVIAQMAPSVRASIGEEFGLKPGTDLTGQMYTAFRLLGFDRVFDVNMGADITTVVEATELVQRIKSKGYLPMFTSCCPAWVKFIEFYYPEMIPLLTTSRSPQIHSGAAYKTWWAEKTGYDPKDIVVVSFMPCTSKKYEASHDKFNIDGNRPVDYVLTTRETAKLLRKYKIDPRKLAPSKVDYAGQYSGAAAIYGATGGVMESALRSAYYYLTGKNLKRIKYESVRGMKDIKRAKVTIGDIKLNVAVVVMPKNFRVIMDELKKNPRAYDYVEFMTCPGGCIGGGGQPVPSTNRIIKQRTKALYAIDDKSEIRYAHENPVVKEFFQYIEKLQKKRQHQILHTHYSKKEKFE